LRVQSLSYCASVLLHSMSTYIYNYRLYKMTLPQMATIENFSTTNVLQQL